MEKLWEIIKKELKEIEEQGINASNLDMVGKMVDIIKDIDTIDAMEKHRKEEYSMYRGDYREDWRGMDGARRGDMRYRMKDKLDRIYDGVDMYEYGKERYRGGDSEERVYDGLEKLMYALCMFVESTMEFAESPREKEIIRKHIDKLRSM